MAVMSPSGYAGPPPTSGSAVQRHDPLARIATATERFVTAIESAVERLCPAQAQIEDVDEEEAVRRLLKEWDKYGEIPLDTFCGVHGIEDKKMVGRIWRELVMAEAGRTGVTER